MTAVSPGSTNQVVMGAANSHTTTAAASPAMRLSTVALRTPSFTRSSLPAPAFCAVKVAAASPKVNVGCVVKMCIRDRLKQVQYELADKTEASGIDFRWQLPEERMPLVLDGQKTCRIFEKDVYKRQP